MRHLRWASGAALALLVAGSAQAVTPADKCESDKNKEAGKYAYCRQKAAAKFATTGDGAAQTTALQKCLDKYSGKWPGLEQKAVAAGGVCPSTGDQSAIQGAADTYTTNVATALAGGVLTDCPADLLSCQGGLTTCNGDLTTCGGDLTTCQADLTTAQADLTTCQGDLATCQAAPQGQRLKTGQTTCYDTAGTVIACAGTGQDGDLQKGLALAYVDNGDGTITDTKTGLMWEKQSDDGSIHDKDTTYTWANAFATKVAALNGGGGFAGYTDWRVPNVNELQSIVNYGAVNPSVSPAFNTGCVASCTVTSCSCTRSSYYWSSTTYQGFPVFAWYVVFADGLVGYETKATNFYVRAVRGGS
jgi:hypothetical protein